MTPAELTDHVKVSDQGSIALLEPLTDWAREWFDDHLPEDRTTWGPATVCEPRYVETILEAMLHEQP